MSVRDRNTAVSLMERAWKSRYDSMVDPPGRDELAQRMQQARADLSEAVAICRELDAKTELVHALRKLGHIEEDLENYDETFRLYDEAVSVAQACGDTGLLAHSIRHLADINQEVGNTEKAAQGYQEAVQLYRSMDNPHPVDLANALRRLALAKESSAAPDEALDLFRETRELYASVNLDEGVAECDEAIARLGR